MTALRDRLFDALLEISLDQAQHIRQLERRMNLLEKNGPGRED